MEDRIVGFKLLPNKSKVKYINCYSDLLEWKNQNQINNTDENVFLKYFKELSKKVKPSTLWAKWSMLKAMTNVNENINIDTYSKLKAFMKTNAKGFISKKSQVMQFDQLTKFLETAPDHFYLSAKVILIFGVFGAMRTTELCNMRTEDVLDKDTEYIVTVKCIKSFYPRKFIVDAAYYDVVKKYINLRPTDPNTERFFLTYHNGKCSRQPIGKNKIGEVPKTIALYLNLDNPENFTGHCFRRTSAILLSKGPQPSTSSQFQTSISANSEPAISPDSDASSSEDSQLSTLTPQQPSTPEKLSTSIQADNLTEWFDHTVKEEYCATPPVTRSKRKLETSSENLDQSEAEPLEPKRHKVNQPVTIFLSPQNGENSNTEQTDPIVIKNVNDLTQLKAVGVHFNNCEIKELNINYHIHQKD